ncbi:AAA family ATPase [Microvirga sp. GCM10011540]|uniref:AAA family ATPase n=1 Tax=Microvirga sp. GCM10011540 TaxID=3317338 RepID=UPI00361DF7C0
MPVSPFLLAAKAVDRPDSTPEGSEIEIAFDAFMTGSPDAAGPGTPPPPSRQGRPASAVALLADLCLDRALGRAGRRLLRRGGPKVVLIRVPTAVWVEPVETAVRELARTGTAVVTATARSKAGAAADEAAARLIARGALVIGIAPALDYLAPGLVAAADLQVTVSLPDAALMSEAVRRWCRRSATGLGPEDLTGLDLPDYAAALRPGSSPQDCVIRLRRAARRRGPGLAADGIPRLEALSGYGAARDWAAATLAEIAQARRAGTRPELESCLFFGPPGTGKTQLAQSLAHTAGLPLVVTSVAEWFSGSAGYLDSIVKQYTQFFETLIAAAAAPGSAVVGFLDEVDAIPNRSTMSGHGSTWWSPVVTGLLLQIDRLRRLAPNVVLLGATNHLERLDPALLRPGRFDRHIAIPPPDEAGRAGILRTHLGPDLPHADLTRMARLCPDATGAVLAGGVRAARRRARAAGRALDEQDLLAELRPADPRPEEERREVALHEAGHAVLALRLGLEVAHVTVQAGGRAAGHTRIMPPGGLPDRLALEAQVVATLAGRAADQVLGRGPTAGAVADLCEATRLVTAIHASFGLGATLAHRVAHEEAEILLRYDPRLSALVEADLQRLMGQAVALVRRHDEAIRTVAGALLARTTLVGDEVARILARAPVPARAGTHPPQGQAPA